MRGKHSWKNKRTNRLLQKKQTNSLFLSDNKSKTENNGEMITYTQRAKKGGGFKQVMSGAYFMDSERHWHIQRDTIADGVNNAKVYTQVKVQSTHKQEKEKEREKQDNEQQKKGGRGFEQGTQRQSKQKQMARESSKSLAIRGERQMTLLQK